VREAFKASTQIEDEGVRLVLLEIGDQKIEKERFASTGAAQNHGVRHIAVMKIQEVRGVVVGLQNGKIFLSEMGIARLATVKGKEKREVRVIRIEQIQRAQVEDVIAGDCRKKGVQEVVFFFVELGIMDAEDFVEVSACPVYLRQVEIVNDDGQ